MKISRHAYNRTTTVKNHFNITRRFQIETEIVTVYQGRRCFQLAKEVSNICYGDCPKCKFNNTEPMQARFATAKR